MSGMVQGVFVPWFSCYNDDEVLFVLLDDDTGDEMIFLLHFIFIVLCAYALDRMFI